MKVAFMAFAVFILLCACLGAETIAITNAKIYTMTGPVIEKGTVVVSDGLIREVGANVSVPSDARVIDAAGKSLFPGFIDSAGQIGLVEIDQVSSTVDEAEATDPVTPQLLVTDAFFPDSVTIGVTRSNGVTTAVVAPEDVNVFAGISAVISLSGKQIDRVVIKPKAGLHVTLGEGPKRLYGERNKMPQTRMGTAALLRETFVKAQDYAAKRKDADGKKSDDEEKTPPERDLRLEAVLEALRGEIPLVVSAHRADDILTAIRIAEEFGIKKNLIINHGTEAHKIAARLAAEKIPVIVGPVTTQPETMETLGAIYENAAILQKAGVLIALQTDDAHNARNLPYEAGIAVANGLPYEEALKAITINAARIFGVDKQLGSIEKGKRADLILADGDPLEPRTVITHIFIAGEQMPDTNYHKQLWDDFLRSTKR